MEKIQRNGQILKDGINFWWEKFLQQIIYPTIISILYDTMKYRYRYNAKVENQETLGITGKFGLGIWNEAVQFSSATQSCLTLCNPMNCSTPGLPVHHHLLEFTQTHVHRVSAAIQPSHPLQSPSPPAPNPSQHQNLFQWVNSSYEVDKVLEFQYKISLV